MGMSNITINPNGRTLWRMDAGGVRGCCVIAARSARLDGETDGIFLKGSDGLGASSVFLSLDEVKSLRDWLNKLPIDSAT